MDIKSEVFRLAELVPRDPEETVLPPGIDDYAIDSFEGRTGLAVPDALRQWLRFTNAPNIGPGGFFGIETHSSSDDIELSYRSDRHPEWLANGWIPVAGDGCGDCYVLATFEQDGPGNPVFFLDQSSACTKPEYVVASDLWHFLLMLFSRELGDKRWPFDKEHVLRIDPNLIRQKNVPLPWDADGA